jgi:hypothetical protein
MIYIEKSNVCFSISYQSKVPKKCLVSSSDILLHVEWLGIAGEQKSSQIKSTLFDKSILKIEQQLYLSCLQSNNFNEFLLHDHIALNTILLHLTEWCRNNIRECLMHSCRLQKRRELASYLNTIDCLLRNSSRTIDHYLHIWLPIIITCLFYEFEVRKKIKCSIFLMIFVC